MFVPDESEMVACDAAVELSKNLSVVPVVTIEPTVLVTAFFSLNVPSVSVSALVDVSASAQVTVIPEPLTVSALSVFPLDVRVPVARYVGATAVYVPPLARVKLPAMFTLVEVTVLVLPVKMRFLNQLLAVIVNALAPALTVKFGAFVTLPPVVPKTTVAVAAILRVNPPVPV